jgi:hypothetical protein
MKEFERTTEQSARCREQLEYAKKRMAEETKKCTDAMKKVLGLCGSIEADANDACYKKHRPYLETACGGKGTPTVISPAALSLPR